MIDLYRDRQLLLCVGREHRHPAKGGGARCRLDGELHIFCVEDSNAQGRVYLFYCLCLSVPLLLLSFATVGISKS